MDFTILKLSKARNALWTMQSKIYTNFEKRISYYTI